MWHPFKKKDRPKFHFDFDTIYQFYNYSLQVASQAMVLLEDLEEEAEMLRYEFPCSFQENQINTRFLQKNKFKNYYELLNKIYAKAHISSVDITESLEKDYQYDILLFNFFTPVPIEQKGFLRNIRHTFYVFFVSENDEPDFNAYRILYSKGLDNSVEDIFEAQFIENVNDPDFALYGAISNFEKVIAAFSRELQLPINSAILKKYPTARLSREVSMQDCKKLIDALNYRKSEENNEKAAYVYKQYQKSREDQIAELEDRERKKDDDYEFYDDGFFPFRFEIFEEDHSYFFDWKFDPEEIEDIISALMNEKWTFEYPGETYSHDLFPYVQIKLAERGLELMNMDTLGDDYIFFIVKKDDVEILLNLSKRMRLGLERLMN